jgi:hypothetical protein
MDGFHYGPTYNWSKGVEPLGGAQTKFAVRWTGQIEAPLTEAYTFSLYKRGRARLWVDGKQVIFAWNEAQGGRESDPIELKAGERYDVQLDYATTRKHPGCSLNWESFSLDRERIPQPYLYPEMEGRKALQPDPRPATDWIEAETFDEASEHIVPDHVRGATIRGLRQRGFGVTGSYVGYARVDFGDGVSKLHARIGGEPAGRGDFDVTVGVHIGEPDGRRIGAVTFRKDDGSRHTVDVESVTGVQDVYVVNETKKKWHFIRFDKFRFE